MKKYDLENITLKETGLFNIQASYGRSLYAHNITTVAELFDEELMKPVYETLQVDTRRLLYNAILILQYRYKGILLPKYDLLDKKLYLKSDLLLRQNSNMLFYLDEDEKERFSLFSLLNMNYLDENRIMNALNNDDTLRITILNSDFKVVDLLDWILKNHKNDVPKYKDLIATYVKAYKRRNADKFRVNVDAIGILESGTELINPTAEMEIKKPKDKIKKH